MTIKSRTETFSNITIYARWKVHRSNLNSRSVILIHLSTLTDPILCGIDKRHPDVYEYGTDPIQNIERDRLSICKTCFKIYMKGL